MPIFLGAFAMIFFAEMGDKSQFMAFSLSGKYGAKPVLLGVFLATLINNGAAIFLGSYLAGVVSVRAVAFIAGSLFALFGLWTFYEGHKAKRGVDSSVDCGWGGFMTIVTLFMLAEMGDKTQLATVVYAASYNAPFLTLAGVVLGMLLADGLGIYLGCCFKDRMSYTPLKIISGTVFLILGFVSILSAL